MRRIVVIGGGFAGLAAALELRADGCAVTVLEARDRWGGRAHTVYAGEHHYALETGAEFIHGRHPVLLRWLKRAQVATTESEGAMLTFEDGKLKASDHERDTAFAVLDDLPSGPEPDIAFGPYLRRQQVSARDHVRVLQFVEGFNAADAERISVAALARQEHAEDEIHADQASRCDGGYSRLVDWMVDECARTGCEMRLNYAVKRIEWSAGEVRVSCSEREQETFDRAVITVPLSLLHARAIEITPPPDPIYSATDAMLMGHAQRISLLFRVPFWKELPVKGASEMSFLFAPDAALAFRVWWTPHPGPAPVITAWLGGPGAESPDTYEEVLGKALAALSQVFSMAVEALRSMLVDSAFHNWAEDEWSRGAYSYVAAGGLAASANLANPVANTLFFAGEHTDTEGHWGTVHAALNSGERAARQIGQSW